MDARVATTFLEIVDHMRSRGSLSSLTSAEIRFLGNSLSRFCEEVAHEVAYGYDEDEEECEDGDEELGTIGKKPYFKKERYEEEDFDDLKVAKKVVKKPAPKRGKRKKS